MAKLRIGKIDAKGRTVDCKVTGAGRAVCGVVPISLSLSQVEGLIEHLSMVRFTMKELQANHKRKRQ